ncbi:MAG: NAD(P)H-quinone oxidoreductase [Magnetovibrionaceae bacterium]
MSNLPETMNCVEIKEYGAPDVLVPATRPLPEVAEGEVLLKVAAAGVNRPDVIQRQGFYAPPPGVTDLPGLEVSGEVVTCGEGVDPGLKGKSFAALVAGGGYAEYVAAPVAQLLPIPGGLDMVSAAALPETFMTVWSNLYDRAGLQKGEWLLVHGGSSGIGTTAIQMASQLGAKVIATAGSEEKVQVCIDLGAELAINYREEDWVEVVKTTTDKRGVNVILDMVGGDYIPKNIKSLAKDGRMVSIAFLKGSKVEVDFMPVMLKRLTLTGATLRARSIQDKQGIAERMMAACWPLLESGDMAPLLYKSFPLTQAAEAHALMESSQHFGKIMLIP